MGPTGIQRLCTSAWPTSTAGDSLVVGLSMTWAAGRAASVGCPSATTPQTCSALPRGCRSRCMKNIFLNYLRTRNRFIKVHVLYLRISHKNTILLDHYIVGVIVVRGRVLSLFVSL